MIQAEPGSGFATAIAAVDDLLQTALIVVGDRRDGAEESADARVDRHQIIAYEFAFIAAEIAAMRAIAAYAVAVGAPSSGAGDDLEVRLAGTFLAETLVGLRARFDRIRVATGLSRATLDAHFESAQVEAIRVQHLAPAALEALGATVCAMRSHGRSALPEDQRILAASLERLVDDRIAPMAQSIHRQDLTVPEEWLQLQRDLGCFGLAIPARYGGTASDSGTDVLATAVVSEELARGSLAAAGSPLTRSEIIARALLAGGNLGQQQSWLPRIASGALLAAVAVTEPDCGSDLAATRLRATRAPGGWRLNGAKTWCTFAGRADVLLVLARTEAGTQSGHRGLSLFLVEKPSTPDKQFSVALAGGGTITATAIPTIGYRGMHSYTLFFDDAHVQEANLVGGGAGEGRGFYLTLQAFSGGRLQTAARACGVMRAAFEAALDYARVRRVFGKPLAEQPLTRARLAGMAATLRASREFTYAVARSMEEGGASMSASLVKLYTCRAAERLTRDAMQLHGGIGYAEESAVSRYFVDARVLSIFEGAEETLALKVIARELLRPQPLPGTGSAPMRAD